MARLPVPGSDGDVWGHILNEFLQVEHNADGILKASGSLSTKEPTITAGTTAQYWRGDKTFQTLDKTVVGLSNVDDTSDVNKPVSTTQQAAINAKVADAINDGTTTIAPSQNAVFDALALKQNSLGFTPENVANKATSTSLGTSDTLYPSQNAVKSYVDTANALDLKIASNLSDLANVATARTNLGLVAGGAGDIWVEKAGDTMIGNLNIAVASGTPLVVNTNTLVADATNNRVGVGTASPGTMLSVAGGISTKAGASTGEIAKVGGKISSNTTAVGNVGVGEDDLMTYTVPANTLATNQDSLSFRAVIVIANNVSAKRVRIKFGATTILDTGAAGIPVSAPINIVVTGEIIRTSATSQLCNVTFAADNATLIPATAFASAAETLSGGVILKITGEAISNNDISQKSMTVRWDPAA